jgi:acyl-CoA oxidase
VRAIARSWAANVGSAIAEHNPIATRRTDEDSLLSARFHAAALRHRERSLLASLSARIRKRTDAGVDGQVAFEACQDHAIALARAHIESFVLESFQKHAAGDRVLEQLCALYALSRIARDFSWFLEDNYLADNKSRAIRKQINGLLEELAPTALPLVEAFGIPGNCLGPLADPAFLKDSGLAP